MAQDRATGNEGEEALASGLGGRQPLTTQLSGFDGSLIPNPYPTLSQNYLPNHFLDADVTQGTQPSEDGARRQLQKVKRIGYRERRDMLSMSIQNRIDRINMLRKAYSPGKS